MSVNPTTLEELLVRLLVTVASDVPVVPMSPAVEVRLTLVPETVPVPLIDVPVIVSLEPETVPLTATAPPAAIVEDVVPFTEPLAPTVVPVPELMETALPLTDPFIVSLLPAPIETVLPLTDPLIVSLVPAPRLKPLVALRIAPPFTAVLVPELKLIVSAFVVLLTANEPLVDSFRVPCAPTVEFKVSEPVLAM